MENCTPSEHQSHNRTFCTVGKCSKSLHLSFSLSPKWVKDPIMGEEIKRRPLLSIIPPAWPGLHLGVGDTQSDSIQCLNFAKNWFIQYSIQYCFTQDSIQNIIQFKINSGDSIQNIIQFNSRQISIQKLSYLFISR